VVYVLHGFADSHRPWAEGMGQALDALVAAGTVHEMIVVAPNGRNGYLSTSPLNLVAEGRANLVRLRALALDYGTRDAFTDIPRSTVAFCGMLSKADVPHLCEAYDGGHEDRLRERIPAIVLPFLSRHLAIAAPR
jgi:hypothetical protein